jgi:hypothetical protein
MKVKSDHFTSGFWLVVLNQVEKLSSIAISFSILAADE